LRYPAGPIFPDLFFDGRNPSRAKRGVPVEAKSWPALVAAGAIATREGIVGDERFSCISDNGRFRHRRQRT
jgi:hypothetical protein